MLKLAWITVNSITFFDLANSVLLIPDVWGLRNAFKWDFSMQTQKLAKDPDLEIGKSAPTT